MGYVKSIKKIKVVIVTPYWTPVKGGVTSVVVNLSRTLQSNGIDVAVIARIGECGKGAYAINENKIVFVIKTLLILYRERPDVMHSHSWWYTLLPSVLYKTFAHRKRLIHTFHTDPDTEEPSGVLNRIKRKIFGRLLNRCDVITFVSADMAEKFRRIMSLNTETVVIYNGVLRRGIDGRDVERFKKQYLLDNRYPTVSWIGPFGYKEKVEGLKLLMGAFKTVAVKYPKAKLIVVGDGDYRGELERFANDLSISNSVAFTGFLENVFIPLEATDIYAHISLKDSMPVSLLEAMSAGKPVIAVPTGGIPEVVIDDQTGILVEPDPKLIADAIIELYENEERMKYLGRNAKEMVEERFNWERIAKEFEDVYSGDVK